MSLSTKLNGQLNSLGADYNGPAVAEVAERIQLRSNPPQHDDDGRKYYELVVRCGGELTLLRYQKQEGSPRVSVPAVLSREALLRLVSDFEAALDELAASE